MGVSDKEKENTRPKQNENLLELKNHKAPHLKNKLNIQQNDFLKY